MRNVTTTFQRRITIEITQDQAVNLATSTASDFNHAVDLMPEEFRQRHQELLDLLLTQLPKKKKRTCFSACRPKEKQNGRIHDVTSFRKNHRSKGAKKRPREYIDPEAFYLMLRRAFSFNAVPEALFGKQIKPLEFQKFLELLGFSK